MTEGWQLKDRSSLRAAADATLLAAPSVDLAIVIQDKDSFSPLLLDRNPTSEGLVPTRVYARESWQSSADAWREWLRLANVHRIDLARYNARHPTIQPETLLEALNQSVNFKTLSDWRELGQMDERTCALARRFDPGQATLRLWNRLSDTDRDRWFDLFIRYPIRKNLIRDIIADCYDLAAEQRTEALQSAENIARAFRGRDSRFPAEEIRDIVHRLRYPHFVELRSRLTQLKRKLGLLRGMKLDLPVDLEERVLELQLRFRSPAELQEQLDSLAQQETQDTIAEIFRQL